MYVAAHEGAVLLTTTLGTTLRYPVESRRGELKAKGLKGPLAAAGCTLVLLSYELYYII